MSDRAPVAELLDPLPIEVARPLVLLRLGYRRPSQVPEKTARLLDEILERGRPLLEPRAVLGEFAVEAALPDRVVLAGALSTRSTSLCERLAGCPTAMLFAATIGPALEDWGGALLAEGAMTRSLLVDAYASAAAIALGMAVETLAARRFGERGLAAGKRYAPGYGDWDLADQTPLCALLGIGRIGIEVTGDHLMIPAKSISGIIGGRPAG